MNKIFLSGSVRRNPNATEQFKTAEKKYYKLYPRSVIFNPTQQNFSGMTEEQIMRICLDALLNSDIIIMLKNWRDSENAITEHRVAKSIGVEVIYGSRKQTSSKELIYGCGMLNR